MSKVTELGYIGLGVSDLDAWHRYLTEVIGLEWVDEREPERAYYRMDSWHHRVVVQRDSRDDLLFLGLRVAQREDLDALCEILSKSDTAYRYGTPEEISERRVMGLVKLHDPSGNPIELFFGPRVDAHKPFHPGRPMFGRFVTGPQGLGHMILRQNNSEQARAFYRLLGFEGDIQFQLALPGGMVAQPCFMKCNDRQHTIGFGLGPMDKRINHLMIEYSDLDDLGLAHDLVARRKIQVAMHLGKHANDHALGFYSANPSGWLFELGWGGRIAPVQAEYSCYDVFGHSTGAKGFGIDLDVSATSVEGSDR
jgi:2,3-dihydroxyethylbenzene 1,2-dioxygenase